MARLNIITKVTGDPNNPLPNTTLSADEVNSITPSVNLLYDGLDAANTLIATANTNIATANGQITTLQSQIASAVSGFKGSLAIASTPSAGVAGYYFPSENGTYTNAGGLVVNLADGLNIITQSAANVFTKIVSPFDFTKTLTATRTTAGFYLGNAVGTETANAATTVKIFAYTGGPAFANFTNTTIPRFIIYYDANMVVVGSMGPTQIAANTTFSAFPLVNIPITTAFIGLSGLTANPIVVYTSRFASNDDVFANGKLINSISNALPSIYDDKSVNVFNIGAITASKAINISNSLYDIVTATGYSLSDYIPCVAGETYTFSNLGTSATAKRVQFDDATKTKLAATPGVTLSSTTGPATITIPTGCFYFCFTTKNTDETATPTQLQVQKGLNATTFEAWRTPLARAKAGISILADKLVAGATIGNSTVVALTDIPSLLNTKRDVSSNLFNRATAIKGTAISLDNNYTILTTNVGGYATSDYIPVIPGQFICFSGTGTAGKRVQYSDASRVIVAATKGSIIVPDGNGNYIFQVPANVFNIKATVQNNDENPNIPATFKIEVVASLASLPTAYEDWRQPTILPTISTDKIKADLLSVGSTMNGKVVATVDQISSPFDVINPAFTKVLVSGSSITNGFRASAPETTSWRALLGPILSGATGRTITVINGGVDGQTTSNMGSNLAGLLSANTPDIVYLECSINDVRSDVNLTPTQTESNLTNMVAAVRAAGAVPIIWGCFPLTLTTATAPATFFSQAGRSILVEVGRKVAKALNVRFIDLDSFLSLRNELLADGVHPNDSGYLAGANILSQAIYK